MAERRCDILVARRRAVPPDEHRWIERHGCRRRPADCAAASAPTTARTSLTDAARLTPALNPGACTVSRLGHEPRVALAVLHAMLAPALAAERLSVLLRHVPLRAATSGDRVEAVTPAGPDGDVTVWADWFLDATETGALLPLAGAEHVTGFESRERTGEPHAPPEDHPGNLQPVSVCFALEHLAGEDHTIDRPAEYDRFAGRWRTRSASGPTSTIPTWTRTCGASAGSPRASCSRRARTPATSRS